VCKEIGIVEISLVICDKKLRLLGDFVPQTPYRAWAAETGGRSGVSCHSNFEGGTCNAKHPPPYDLDRHKCSAEIVLFLINYANSALSALQNAHKCICNVKNFPRVIPRTTKLEGDDHLPGIVSGGRRREAEAAASPTLRVGHAMQNATPL